MIVESTEPKEDDKHFDKCCEYTAIVSILVTIGVTTFYLLS